MTAPQINNTYVSVALAMGVSDLTTALTGTGLTAKVLNTPGSLDVADVVTIVRNVVDTQSNPLWPVELGEQLGVASHGPVGFATLSAPTIEQALMTFTNWFRVRCETYRTQVRVSETTASIEIHDTTGDAVFAQVFFLAIARAIEVILAQLLGTLDSRVTAIEMKAEPALIESLTPKFQSTLMPGRDKNCIRIPIPVWSKPSILSDPESYKLNLQKCQQLKLSHTTSTSLEQKVEQLLDSHFNWAHQQPDTFSTPPSVQDLCAMLHLTERTFYRKLKHAGTSYKSLLKTTRFEHAKQLLLGTELAIHDVASILGYQEAANFCRAFRAWSGVSAGEFRNNNN